MGEAEFTARGIKEEWILSERRCRAWAVGKTRKKTMQNGEEEYLANKFTNSGRHR